MQKHPSSSYARILFRHLRLTADNCAAYFADTDVTFDDLMTLDDTIPAAALNQIYRNALALSAQQDLGLAVGAQLRLSSHGPLGVATFTGPDLRTGLALVVGMERGARQHSRELAEELLAIDQEDSLGLKELVLDQLLRDDRNEEALALTEEPQKDDGSLVLGLLMGRTLALYRLGQQEAAEAALAEVVAHNRHALELICAENPRPSMPHPDGQVDPGSRAEAWQYRTLMRDQWRTTPGALDWLASHR